MAHCKTKDIKVAIKLTDLEKFQGNTALVRTPKLFTHHLLPWQCPSQTLLQHPHGVERGKGGRTCTQQGRKSGQQGPSLTEHCAEAQHAKRTQHSCSNLRSLHNVLPCNMLSAATRHTLFIPADPAFRMSPVKAGMQQTCLSRCRGDKLYVCTNSVEGRR